MGKIPLFFKFWSKLNGDPLVFKINTSLKKIFFIRHVSLAVNQLLIFLSTCWCDKNKK